MRMEYNKLRDKIGKFYNGGKVQKFDLGGNIPYTEEQKQQLRNLGVSEGDIEFAATGEISFDDMLVSAQSNQANSIKNESTVKLKEGVDFGSPQADENNANAQSKSGLSNFTKFKDGLIGVGKQLSGVDFNNLPEGMSEGAAMGMGIAAKAGVGAMKAIDNLAMGDKNFSTQSQAIDSTVHSVSSALMSSGNIYAMCCCAGTKVYTNQGITKNIEDLKQQDGILGYLNKECIQQPIEKLFDTTYKECVQIETENGNVLRCSIDHPIYSALKGRAKYVTVGKKKQRKIKEFSFRRSDELKIGDYVAEIGEIPFFGDKHIKLAYLIGMLIGDGTYGRKKSPRLFTGDPCTWKYIEDNNLGKLTEVYLPGERYSKEFRVYTCYGLNPLMREFGLYGQTKNNKRLPINIHEWDKESCAALIAGLIDTDGFVECDSKQHAGVSFSQSNLELIKQLKSILLKFGIHGTIIKHPAKSKYIKGRQVFSKETFILNIKTRESVINFYNNITLNINYKQENLQKAYLLKLDTKARDTSLEYHNVVADRIKRIIKLGYLPVYNLCAGISHTYIADNIITHNTAGAALEGANFLTKAGGQTVQGFDVNIENSGFGTLGHMESSSSRDFGAMIGLGGIFNKGVERRLAKRNEQARMALQAAEISGDVKFEQEARMNSVDNVLRNNQIALAGGVDLSLI